jgi:multimeric flavodoxin WrbA
MQLKTVVLFSSPNRRGNTGVLLDNFLKECQGEVEIINVFDLKVKPCIDCRYCYKTGKCIIRDDMDAVYEKIENCDALIIASPMHFTSFPGPLKLVIDRFQAYWSRKFILKDQNSIKRKMGVLIMTSGLKDEAAFSHAEAMMKQFFSIVNAEFFLKIYGLDTDKHPVKDNEELKKYAVQKGKDLCGEV